MSVLCLQERCRTPVTRRQMCRIYQGGSVGDGDGDGGGDGGDDGGVDNGGDDVGGGDGDCHDSM